MTRRMSRPARANAETLIRDFQRAQVRLGLPRNLGPRAKPFLLSVLSQKSRSLARGSTGGPWDGPQVKHKGRQQMLTLEIVLKLAKSIIARILLVVNTPCTLIFKNIIATTSIPR